MNPLVTLHPLLGRRRWLGRLGLGSLIGLLALWWAVRGVDLANLAQILLTLSPAWLLAALGGVTAVSVTKAARWRVLYGLPGRQLPFADLFFALVSAQSVNILIPIRLGELIRVGWLKQAGRPGAVTLSTIVVEKAVDLLAAGVVATTLMAITTVPGWFGRPAIGLLLAGLLLAGGLASLWALRTRLEAGLAPVLALGRIIPLAWQNRLLRLVRGLVEALGLLSRWQTLALVLLWTLLVWLVSLLTIAALFAAFHLPLSLAALILIVLGANFSNLTAAPGHIGVIPMLAVLVLGFYGISQPVAVGFGLVLNGVMVAPLVVLGAGALWFRAMELLAWLTPASAMTGNE
jgi:uncharacterized membrane protein YbhN (UPF0104 family)